MKNLEHFKKEREFFTRHSSIAIDATRSKFEVDDRTVKGYPVVWGEKNDYGEIVLRGATLNSLNARGVEAVRNPIVVLNQHRTAEILCRPEVLQEDEYGLYFEGKIIEGAQYADEALAQIRQGVLKQLSYGFNYIWDKVDYDEASDAYILREIKLWEISVVTFSSGDSAQLRSYAEYQKGKMLEQFTPEQIRGIQSLLMLQNTAATSTVEEQESKPKITVF